MARTVKLTFILQEDVTPELFGEKIAMACARGGAIRVGERVALDADVQWARTENIVIPAGVVGKHEIRNVPNVLRVEP